MALEGGNQGKGIKFLNIVGGYIWDKSQTGNESPLYKEQSYTLAGEERTRSGFAYSRISGKVVKVIRDTEGQYGERLIIQLRDGDEYYQLSYGVSGSWGKFSQVETITKVLMAIDPNKPLTIGVAEDRGEGSDFIGTKFYYSQEGERVYVLSKMDWAKPTDILLGNEAKSFIESLEYPTKAKYEHLPISKAKKLTERDREDYIEALISYADDNVFGNFNDSESELVESKADVTEKPTAQSQQPTTSHLVGDNTGVKLEEDDLPF